MGNVDFMEVMGDCCLGGRICSRLLRKLSQGADLVDRPQICLRFGGARRVETAGVFSVLW